jgi:CheY-like chemotaxis protein
MLVEDNDMNQELALELLANAGIDVTLAVNGKEAVDKIAADSAYDGVLMDCQMPVMDGYTATREIRKNPALKDLPIIAMTANAMAGDREKVLDAGMNDHIAKPLNVVAMFTTMAKWIKPKATTPKTPPDAPNSGAASAMNTGASGGNYVKVDAIPADPFALLVGIDVKAGLATTMDNHKLYTRLLNKFKDSQCDFAALFAAALADADTSAPARAAHTLKGTAGNIGAKGVQAAAADLEHACQEGADATRLEPLLQATLVALEPVIQGLRAFAGEVPAGNAAAAAPASSAPPTAEQGKLAAAALDRLEALLRESDVEASDLLDEVMEQAQGTALGFALKRVAKAVEEFDFDAALAALQQARG